jgi:hypothetical protein
MDGQNRLEEFPRKNTSSPERAELQCSGAGLYKPVLLIKFCQLVLMDLFAKSFVANKTVDSSVV